MKTFENRFGAVVELRNVGDDVVAAKVSFSMNFDRVDSAYLSGRILAELLPTYVDAHRLYDGSYVIVSRSVVDPVSNMCFAPASCSIASLDSNVELNDGLIHTVHISLNQSDDVRRDYVVCDVRYVVLRGTISVEVEGDDDEALEA